MINWPEVETLKKMGLAFQYSFKDSPENPSALRTQNLHEISKDKTVDSNFSWFWVLLHS